MNSENRKTSHPNRLSHNLINKADLQKCEKVLHYQILVSTTYGKIKKSSNKNNKFKIS